MNNISYADFILILHALFVATVVFSVPLIILGGLLSWRWVHYPLFRLTHLGMILFVAAEALIGMTCPLTVWENNLREADHQQGYGGQDFVAHWLGRLLFYSFPHSVFIAIYLGYSLLIVGLFYFVPLRRKSHNA